MGHQRSARSAVLGLSEFACTSPSAPGELPSSTGTVEELVGCGRCGSARSRMAVA